jgi:hypothetical protein
MGVAKGGAADIDFCNAAEAEHPYRGAQIPAFENNFLIYLKFCI